MGKIKYSIYTGTDLGAVYTKEKTMFRVWAPTAEEVCVKLYQQGLGGAELETLPMEQKEAGTWKCEKTGDLHGIYYTYCVKLDGKTQETVDIYAKAAGVNGNRGMVVDLEATNPENFEEDIRPPFYRDTDAVIYELHIRDLSIDKDSGIKEKGKFLGLTQRGSVNQDGLSTGLDHIVDLGVTHVQILPSFDYATVDESQLDKPQFNWGYDPKNFNVPEGSYSTDPYHAEVRIKEMKKMIQVLHQNGLRVNMDVVYNHTFDIYHSWFQKTVPDYYYRKKRKKYGNGSGCGNETASEREMMRKYIVDSVVYWAKEYHIDGFRFDLMAVHDIDTMKAVRSALDEIDTSIMVYGEGWKGGESYLPDKVSALKSQMAKLLRVGAFQDDLRDAIKGSVFLPKDQGFVNGKQDMEEAIKYGITGATRHQQIRYDLLQKESWAAEPGQSINYVSCHDNYALWDKLALSAPDKSCEERRKMNKLAAAIVMTAQGIPFFQAGEELLRTKPSTIKKGELVENSYASPDETNSIKWADKKKAEDIYHYYKGLIAFRRTHAALRMETTQQIQKYLSFIEPKIKNVVAFVIQEENNKSLLVIYNANETEIEMNLPEGTWNVYINGKSAGNQPIGVMQDKAIVEGISCLVLEQ